MRTHRSARPKSLVRKPSTHMTPPGQDDSKLSTERVCSTYFLSRWRRELLIDETEGDANAIELDRRVLDYYLDSLSKW